MEPEPVVYGSKLVSGFQDRRPPLEQTVHYEGEYGTDVAVVARPRARNTSRRASTPKTCSELHKKKTPARAGVFLCRHLDLNMPEQVKQRGNEQHAAR